MTSYSPHLQRWFIKDICGIVHGAKSRRAKPVWDIMICLSRRGLGQHRRLGSSCVGCSLQLDLWWERESKTSLRVVAESYVWHF